MTNNKEEMSINHSKEAYNKEHINKSIADLDDLVKRFNELDHSNISLKSIIQRDDDAIKELADLLTSTKKAMDEETEEISLDEETECTLDDVNECIAKYNKYLKNHEKITLLKINAYDSVDRVLLLQTELCDRVPKEPSKAAQECIDLLAKLKISIDQEEIENELDKINKTLREYEEKAGKRVDSLKNLEDDPVYKNILKKARVELKKEIHLNRDYKMAKEKDDKDNMKRIWGQEMGKKMGILLREEYLGQHPLRAEKFKDNKFVAAALRTVGT